MREILVVRKQRVSQGESEKGTRRRRETGTYNASCLARRRLQSLPFLFYSRLSKYSVCPVVPSCGNLAAVVGEEVVVYRISFQAWQRAQDFFSFSPALYTGGCLLFGAPIPGIRRSCRFSFVCAIGLLRSGASCAADARCRIRNCGSVAPARFLHTRRRAVC